MIVKIVLPIILAFIMYSLGLGLRISDFTRIARFPKAFSIGLINQLILLPLIAFGIVKAFGISGELAVGIMILGFCPGGVTTNVLTRFVNAHLTLSISMTAVTSLLSIVTVPFLVALSVDHFMGVDAPAVNVTKLGLQMFAITAVPVALGMTTTHFGPKLTDKISKPFAHFSLALFVLVIIAALAKNWAVVWGNLPTLGPALVTLNVILLLLGFFSSKAAKLNPKDAATIAIESGIQNGTLGIAVGSLIAVMLHAKGVEGSRTIKEVQLSPRKTFTVTECEVDVGINETIVVQKRSGKHDGGRKKGMKAADIKEHLLLVKTIEVTGPIVESWPPPPMKRLFGDFPKSPKKQDAVRMLHHFAEKAYRRPLSKEQKDTIARFFNDRLGVRQ